MAAEVETMFYTRQIPWHGLGTRVVEAPTSKETLYLAGGTGGNLHRNRKSGHWL